MLKSYFSDWLVERQACSDARVFVSTNTLEQAWATCNRPIWMLWLLGRIGYNDQQTLRLYACWCAANTPLSDGRKTWDLLTDGRSRKAILVAIDYANGEATREELDAARAAAWAAAWGAARAAVRAAAPDAADAAWGAADVAWDAAWDAAWGAARAAWAAQADELRRRIPYKTILKLARKAGIEA